MGRSNSGKSSLINALVGRKALAYTSKTPGKTRMLNVYRVESRFHLVDLPGYGYARVSKTVRHDLRRLRETYLSQRKGLAGVIWLLDVRRDPTDDDRAMAEVLGARRISVLAALTKVDKVSRARRMERRRSIQTALRLEEDQCILTSARTREGIAELREAIDELVRMGRSK